MYIEDQVNYIMVKLDEVLAKISSISQNKVEEKYVTPQQLADIFQCSVNHIYIKIRDGSIKTVENLGDLKRIPMSQFSNLEKGNL